MHVSLVVKLFWDTLLENFTVSFNFEGPTPNSLESMIKYIES